jgi:hypothetical protein
MLLAKRDLSLDVTVVVAGLAHLPALNYQKETTYAFGRGSASQFPVAVQFSATPLPFSM